MWISSSSLSPFWINSLLWENNENWNYALNFINLFNKTTFFIFSAFNCLEPELFENSEKGCVSLQSNYGGSDTRPAVFLHSTLSLFHADHIVPSFLQYRHLCFSRLRKFLILFKYCTKSGIFTKFLNSFWSKKELICVFFCWVTRVARWKSTLAAFGP